MTIMNVNFMIVMTACVVNELQIVTILLIFFKIHRFLVGCV